MAVALNAVVNYWFFIGSAVFCILYFAFRCTDKSWGANFKKFCWVAFEAILGMGLSLFVFLPAVLGILGNPRTTSDNLLSGWNFWLYCMRNGCLLSLAVSCSRRMCPPAR